MGTHDRRENEGGRESGVIEEYERSVESDSWGPQLGKRAVQYKECQEVTSLMKIQNGPNEGAETNKEQRKGKGPSEKGKVEEIGKGAIKEQ